VLIQAR